MVGDRVGVTDGKAVNFFVGDLDGFRVAFAVGDTDGRSVDGLEVGRAEVGG